MAYKGVEELRKLLACKREGVGLRYLHYEQKARLQSPAIPVPPAFKNIQVTLGWCAKAVDTLADRLTFREFRNDILDMNAIYRMNNGGVLTHAAMLSALISACSFLYISRAADGYPRIQAIDGGRATGIADPITGMLQEGYAVLEKDPQTDEVLLEAYFTPGKTEYIYRNGKKKSVKNPAAYPLLVPVVYRPDEMQPFGRPRITRACMSIAQEAMQTLRLMQICAEFYSFPQKYILGMDDDAAAFDKWQATMTSMLRIDMGESGEKPTVGQFQQASMAPYVEQLRACAAVFAGETGLTFDDLGFVSDNPASAEAIKAAHDNLCLTARAAQASFGVGFRNAGYLAACVRDENDYDIRTAYSTEAVWEPVFAPDMSALGQAGDGAIKLNEAVPGFVTDQMLSELTGLRSGS